MNKKVKKVRKTPRSIDEYCTFPTDDILQDARIVLDYGNTLYRRALAGTIMVSLDSFRMSEKQKKEEMALKEMGRRI